MSRVVSSVRLTKRADGVAVITFDTPDSKVNVISRELLGEIGPALDEIERDPGVRACVLASGKPGTFIAGADLRQIRAIQTEQEGAAFSRTGHALLERLARCPKPFVAAIDGAALGGGLEIALACRYILASDDPKTVLALPEVMVGLLPGGGGTQRLPARIGLVEALPLMLTGKRVRARKALRLGLVDALTSPGGIADTAARAALLLADGKLARGERRLPLAKRVLETAPLRPLVLRRAREEVRAKTRGNYPAPLFILDCVATGLSRGRAAGLAKEAELFGKLVAGPEAKNLIRLFEEMNDLKKPASDARPRPVRRLAVLGGGFMGSGIAEVSVPLSPVTVKDVSDEVLARCARQVRDGLDSRVRSQAISRFERDRLMARLYLTTDGAALRGADVVIEAVFEELELKRRILAEAESVIAPETVFASNTSALPITQIASRARHPERVLGMHYFSPVPKMPLLELVITDQTAPWATATAREYGIRQGKTVIVVRDGPGFYTSRILSPYLGEAIHLLAEGARVEDIDEALRDFGYPVGPMALLDEVGIDVAAHVSRNLGAVYAHRGLAGGEAFVKLHEAGYSGRKNKRGFYLYDGPGKKKRVNEQIYEVLAAPARRTIPRERLAERLALLMANEAVWCLDEGILASPRDGDVGAILGLGFPPFRGGPFTWLDAQGLPQVVTRMERLRDEHGPRFAPAPLLRRLASQGETFSS